MTDAGPLHLAVIVGSVRARRIGPLVARWFVERAAGRPDFVVDLIDLAEFDLPLNLSRTPDAERFAARVDAADAIVAVTPEYNHGPSAALKNAFDHLKREWRAKPAGFVAYGGLSGGLRAIEQLRQVVAELHMVSVRETVSLHLVRDLVVTGELKASDAASDAAGRLLDQLAWWGKALRAARPYPGSGGER